MLPGSSMSLRVCKQRSKSEWRRCSFLPECLDVGTLKHPCFRTLGYRGAAVCYPMMAGSPVTPVTLSVQDSWQGLLVHKEPQIPGAHTVEEIGSKAHAIHSIICWCQHQELCGGVDACVLRAGPLAKQTQLASGEFLLSLWHSVLPLTLFLSFPTQLVINSTLEVLANLRGMWHKTFYNDGKDTRLLFPIWRPQPYVTVECLKGGQCD